MVLLLVLSTIVAALSGLVYYFGYRQLDVTNLDGAPYLPELKFNYGPNRDYLFYCCCAGGAVLVLALPTARWRSPCFSLIFIFGCLTAAVGMLWTGMLITGQIETMVSREEICALQRALDLKDEVQELVNRWMCTSDCPCYNGASNATMETWAAYSTQELAPFFRTVGSKIVRVDGVELLPFKWTSERSLAKHTFRQCYEEVLIPKRKFTKEWQTLTDAFFKGGGYKMLSELEKNFGNCSSLCNIPLFHITVDVEEGRP